MTKVNDKETNSPEESKSDETPKKKTLSLGGTLSLKGSVSNSGSATRNATQGRTGASVAVEIRRKRTSLAEAKEDDSKKEELSKLTQEERDARAEALRKAMEEGGTRKSRLPERHDTHNERFARKPERNNPQGDNKKTSDTEAKHLEEEEQRLAAETQAVRAEKSGVARGKESEETEQESYRDRLKKAAKQNARKSAGDRRGGRITVTQALNEDYERDRGPSLAAQKRAREKARMSMQAFQEPTQKQVREIQLPETITVGELANRMAEPNGDVVKALMKLGVMATITQTIDADTAELVIDEFGHKVNRVTDADVEIGVDEVEDKEEDLQDRPPVVTIMGHVDHGKTSLLDAMRKTDVVAGEAGGITQHIGAYQISAESDPNKKITFIDTPGHAAFTEMRSRGANVTDIVVIVVAADDSIMPQTIEAINHAKAAEVPVIIAINKIDLPAADPMKVKTELLQHEIVVEDMSGEVQCVEVSALQKMNLDKLEEAILLQSEMLELTANPGREGHGVIVESKLEIGRGPVATVLIQNGTLRVGDVFVAGAEAGKVRALVNDKGDNVNEAIPGEPVEVLGIDGVPEAGDLLAVVESDARAREISTYRQRKKRESQAAIAVSGRTTIEDLMAAREEGEKTTLPVVIKADVHGSVEAIAGSLQKMVDDNEGIAVEVLHTGVGGITESDVTLAKASNGVIIGFNVRAGAQARDQAQQNGVDIRYYNVIYDVIDDAKTILTGMLAPKEREEYIGQALIKEVFNITKVGKIAGCEVQMGSVKRGSKVRLLRDDVVIHEGMLKTLKRFKDEVKEVKEGMECGMAFESYDDIKEGDVIECFELIEEQQTVE